MRILEQPYHGNLQPEEMGFIQNGQYEKYLQAMIAAENELKLFGDVHQGLPYGRTL